MHSPSEIRAKMLEMRSLMTPAQLEQAVQYYTECVKWLRQHAQHGLSETDAQTDAVALAVSAQAACGLPEAYDRFIHIVKSQL